MRSLIPFLFSYNIPFCSRKSDHKIVFDLGNSFQLLFILLFLPSISIAQNYYLFPSQNAKWSCIYSERWELGNNHGYDSWEECYFTNGDTTINTVLYTQLFQSTYETHTTYYGSGGPPLITHGGIPPNYFGAFRNDSVMQKVFIYPAYSNSEKIMYDFTIQIGDTIKNYNNDTINGWWTFRWLGPSDPIVESIDSMLIENSYRRKINFVPVWGGPVSLIDGIGQTSGLFNPLMNMDGAGGQMICVSVNSQPIYPDTNYSCIILNILQTKPFSEINVFPNPAQSYLKISSIETESKYHIFDRCGSMVQTGEINSKENTIPVSKLKSGLYIIQIFTSDENVLRRFMIQN